MEVRASDRSPEVERWKTDEKRHQFYPDAMEELYQSVRVYGSCFGEKLPTSITYVETCTYYR